MNVEKYYVRTTRTTIETWATSVDAARDIVCKAELCPASAILSVESETERTRKAVYRANPFLESYVATMLEDLQFSDNDAACEEEREAGDTGTIYTVADNIFARCKADCEAFQTANAADLEEYADDVQAGYYFYMTRVGHGVTFTDNGDADCLQRLADAARAMRLETAFLDGEVHLA